MQQLGSTALAADKTAVGKNVAASAGRKLVEGRVKIMLTSKSKAILQKHAGMSDKVIQKTQNIIVKH